MVKLTAYEKTRYNRQMMLQGWGEKGQKKLKSSSIFIAGAGGLGGPVSIYLAVAGVGNIRICDADTVELSNLNRQILHTETRIGWLKAVSAGKTLRELNSSCHIETFSDFLEEKNLEKIIGHPDIIVDCLDNFDTRYLLNSYCITKRIPLVHGAIHGLTGQVTVLKSPDTACLRCLFPEPPSKEISPVVGATPGIIGSIQALEIIKLITNRESALKGKLLIFDGEDMMFNSVRVKRVASCPDCSRMTL
ncbi:MAG: HesA/MoeB/ThiF family protein [Calditrichia bacterium]|nr:HesA/MoeB/ThiF family protein [Calditrichia bacterium]